MLRRYKCLFVAAIVMLISLQHLSAQEVKIGQAVPDFTISEILNYKSPSAKFSEFKGKAVILDFWAFWCSACIKGFPKIDSLQARYKDDLQFILVTDDSKQKVSSFFNGLPHLRHIKLPSVVSDIWFRKMFPYRTLPHLVWIDKEGIVKAITAPDKLTTENINALIQGKNIDVKVKEDEMNPYISRALVPFVSHSFEKYQDHMLDYYYFGEQRDGLNGTYSHPRYDKEKGHTRVYAQNSQIDELYKVAYHVPRYLHRTQIIYDFPNPDKYKYDRVTKKNSLCYERIAKGNDTARVYRLMKQDLDNFFGLSSSLESRKMKCLVLRRTSNVDKLKTQGGQPFNHIERGMVKVRNVPFIVLTQNQQLSGFDTLSPIPFIDETGYTGKIDMEFPASFDNMEALLAALAKYDLTIVEEERDFKTIILKAL